MPVFSETGRRLGRVFPTMTAAALAVIAGCSATGQEVKVARASGYHAKFAVVYSAALDVVRDLYPQVSENPVTGVIKTAWHPINVQQGQSSRDPQNTGPNPFAATTLDRTQYFIRFEVRVVGGDPWEVHIDSQASEWEAGEVPVELKGADEPHWLQGRTDALYVAIHDRLEQYAVPLAKKQKAKKVASKSVKAPTQGQFPGLDPAAVKVLQTIAQAAQSGDADALRPFLADDLTWSIGGAPSADTAVAIWRADPSLLIKLAEIIGSGCREHGAQVVCPPATVDDPHYAGYRAGFALKDGAWKMVFFVSGN